MRITACFGLSEKVWKERDGTALESYQLYNSDWSLTRGVSGIILGTASSEALVQISYTDSQFIRKTILCWEDGEAKGPSYFFIVTGGEPATPWVIEHTYK